MKDFYEFNPLRFADETEAQTSEEINACWQSQGENPGPLSSGPVSVATSNLIAVCVIALLKQQMR